MPIGPGKYDDLCTIVRERANALAAIVIIVGGDKGQGFSVQTADPLFAAQLPAVLENMARDIRAALKEGTV